MSLNILSGRVSPLLCRRRAKLAKFGISSFLHPDNKQGIGQIRPGTEDDTPTGCMSIPGGQVRSIRDLPMETLYIIDGTAMLYHAHYSRETSFQYSDATLTPKLSIELRSSLQLDMDAYRAQQRSPSEFILKHNGSKNDDADQHNALYCGALISMAAKFARFVRDVRPSYVAVAFDTGGKTFRNDIDVLYKATRRPPPLSLLPQFGIAPLVLEEMGARCFQKPGYEADDVMASLSDWARRRGFHVVLISGDKDMLQLVGSAVFVLNPSAKDMALTGTHEIFEKYQVQAHQLADFYALVGDAADNIPGVRGLGPKGASTLLRYFGNLESIISKLALPNKGVDVLCVDALTTAGIQHELLPEKKPRASKVSTTSVSASSLSEKARFRIQFDVEVVRYITECFAQDGARGSPIALVEKLVRTGADDLRKYLSLVRLRSYLLPELMTTGRYAQKQTQEFRHTALSVEEIPSDSNLNMSYCHYRGEREHTAMNNLLAISPMLRKPLQMLRKQKIESDLKTM